MTYEQGDPLYHCRSCDGLMVAPHYSAADCPAFGQADPAPPIPYTPLPWEELAAQAYTEGWREDGFYRAVDLRLDLPKHHPATCIACHRAGEARSGGLLKGEGE
jgi:hypothetical protein